MSSPSRFDDDWGCTTSPRDWAGLILTILAMNVAWWLSETPLLFTRGPRHYLRSVTWQCFRMYTPACAMVYALIHARSPEEEPYIYYVGPFLDEPNSTPSTPGQGMNRWQVVKAIGVDMLTVVSTALTIAQAIDLPEDAPASGIAFTTWTYPSLPVAVLGLWLLFSAWMRWSRKLTLFLGLLVVVGIGAAVIAPVATLSAAARKSKIWIAAIVAYGFMALPVLVLINGPGFIIAIGLGFIIRVGGVGLGALSDMAYFPFCELKNKAFGGVYLAVGAIGAILGIVGFWKYILRSGLPNNPRNKPVYRQMVRTDGEAVDMENRERNVPISNASARIKKVEEETFPDYLAARYYPVRIGEIFASRYQVVGKLGYGPFSTVWLARDLSQGGHVAPKVFIRSQAMGSAADHELNMYRHMARVSATSKHPGRDAIRSLLASFKVVGPDGEHHCLVHPPLWESIKFLGRNPIGRLAPPVLGIVLQRLFLALDFMHTECQLVHTDLKMDNIMFGIEDDAVFEDFEKEEQENPIPRKEVDGRLIYLSRELNVPKNLGPPVLCDFGAAVSGVNLNVRDAQPDLYRAPKMILQIPWQYEIDLWNAGCMVWDMFEGRHMFSGRDPHHGEYRGRAHLASIISLMGPPPRKLVERSTVRDKFFSKEGLFDAGIGVPPASSFEEIETTLEGDADKAEFVRLVRKMVEWMPEKRSTARELLEDEWLRKQL